MIEPSPAPGPLCAGSASPGSFRPSCSAKPVWTEQRELRPGRAAGLLPLPSISPATRPEEVARPLLA
eukprot:169806-Hanusia_phi.AAC.1